MQQGDGALASLAEDTLTSFAKRISKKMKSNNERMEEHDFFTCQNVIFFLA